MAVDELTLDDLTPSRVTGPCKVGKILAKLSDTERGMVETALAGPKEQYPHAKIATALSKRVWPVSDHAVSDHRSGACVCGR